MKHLLAGCLLCCVTVAATPSAQAEEPLDVIKKAIKAYGGAKNLTKYPAMVAKGKGVVNTQGMELKYEPTWNFHYPGKFRIDIDADFNGMNIAIKQVFDGKEGWQKLANMEAAKMNADQVSALKQQMQVDDAGRLVPLLDTKKYKIASVGESEVKGKKTIGLNVTTKDGLDVNFYFDKKTLYLPSGCNPQRFTVESKRCCSGLQAGTTTHGRQTVLTLVSETVT